MVTQYREQGEEVLPVLQVLQKAAAILERQLSPVLILGVNISGVHSTKYVFFASMS